MAPKQTAQSPARKLLLHKFLSKELTGKENPKEVWESEQVFMKHKLSNFRNHFNKLRNEHMDGTISFFCTFISNI